MKYYLIIACLLITSPVFGQDSLSIQPQGQKLKDIYLSMNVESLWVAGHHVNWETGMPDMPDSKHGNKTHCSAFIAAACKKLNIYVLRPPQHGQILLANAQADWLNSDSAKNNGWIKLNNEPPYQNSQKLANAGKIVIAIYKNTDASKPGHAALVMPADRSAKLMLEQGPEVIMAGTHNHNFISLKNGFRSHIQTWPEHEIQFFMHDSVFK